MKRTKEEISRNMARIRSTNTTIEKLVRSELRRQKIRYKGQVKEVKGKPDFVILDKKVAIFCDSAFWHGYKFPQSNRHRFNANRKFWIKKISTNMRRDRSVSRTLREEGWRVFRFWDFQIKKDVEKCVRKIEEYLRTSAS